MSETSLYPAVKRFLEGAGFCVKGEIKGCDVVAVQVGGQLRLAIVEMKLGFNLDLLLQAMDRMRVADEVWLAVPATRRGRDRDPRVHRLCRAIGFGLMAVNLRRNRVEVLAEPGPYRPRSDTRRRTQVLSEHARRNGDPSPGGSARQPIMTAYRQQALVCAGALRSGPGRPRDLREVAPDAGQILLRNVYGWFERTARGVYRLTDRGEAALERWPCVVPPLFGELTLPESAAAATVMTHPVEQVAYQHGALSRAGTGRMVTPVPGATVICPLPCDKLVGAPTHPDTLRLYTGPTLWQNNVTLRTSLSIARPRLEPRKTDKQPDQETPKVCKEGVSLTTVFDVATRECRSR